MGHEFDGGFVLCGGFFFFFFLVKNNAEKLPVQRTRWFISLDENTPDFIFSLSGFCPTSVPFLSSKRACRHSSHEVLCHFWWAAVWLLPGWVLGVQTPMENACAPVQELLFSVLIQFLQGSLMVKNSTFWLLGFFYIFLCFHTFISHPSNAHTSVSRNC